jgi:hypothetical protein
MTWIQPAPANAVKSPNGFNPHGWQDELLTGSIPAERNNAMQRLIARWRTRLSERECRKLAYPLAEEWNYDEAEYTKLNGQITRAYAQPAIYEVPEVPEAAGSADVWDSFLADVNKPVDRSRVIPTPWATVNTLMQGGGFFPSTLGYIGGRRNAGKSALKQQLAYHAAVSGFRVLDLTLEMSVRYCIARMVGQQSEGMLRPQWIRAWLYGDRSRSWVGGTIADVTAKIREACGGRLQIRSDLRSVAVVDEFLSAPATPRYDVVFIDQMQHLAPPPGSQEGWGGMAANSRALVQLANTHDIAIVALAQINRADSKDRNEDAFTMPRLNELKGGSVLEHDAEWVWNLCPLDGTYKTLRVNMPKLRGLPGGEVRLDHDPLYNLTTGDGHLVTGGAT